MEPILEILKFGLTAESLPVRDNGEPRITQMTRIREGVGCFRVIRMIRGSRTWPIL